MTKRKFKRCLLGAFISAALCYLLFYCLSGQQWYRKKVPNKINAWFFEKQLKKGSKNHEVIPSKFERIFRPMILWEESRDLKELKTAFEGDWRGVYRGQEVLFTIKSIDFDTCEFELFLDGTLRVSEQIEVLSRTHEVGDDRYDFKKRYWFQNGREQRLIINWEKQPQVNLTWQSELLQSDYSMTGFQLNRNAIFIQTEQLTKKTLK